MSYLHECVSTYGLDKYLNLKHKVVKADWSSETQTWTVQVNHDGQPKTYTVKWLMMCPGYFDYHEPFPAVIPGIKTFQGKVVPAQFWPADYDFTDKKMVVIGSGANCHRGTPSSSKGWRQARHHAAPLAVLRRLAPNPRRQGWPS